jgi:pilus assembly protein Flp/PilA
MLALVVYLKSLLTSEDEGATAVEYGLMVALIAGVIFVAVGLLGTAVNTAFTNVTGAF